MKHGESNLLRHFSKVAEKIRVVREVWVFVDTGDMIAMRGIGSVQTVFTHLILPEASGDDVITTVTGGLSNDLNLKFCQFVHYHLT